MSALTVLEWVGAVVGLAGAFLLAANTRVSALGWICFLCANFCMIGLAIGLERFGFLLQQVGFTASSLLGIYRAGLLKPLMGLVRRGES